MRITAFQGPTGRKPNDCLCDLTAYHTAKERVTPSSLSEDCQWLAKLGGRRPWQQVSSRRQPSESRRRDQSCASSAPELGRERHPVGQVNEYLSPELPNFSSSRKAKGLFFVPVSRASVTLSTFLLLLLRFKLRSSTPLSPPSPRIKTRPCPMLYARNSVVVRKCNRGSLQEL